MKTNASHIPEILDQVIHTAQQVTDDDWLHKKVAFDVMENLREIDFDRSRSEVALDSLRQTYKILGDKDPYSGYKNAFFDALMAKEKTIESWVNSTKDPVHTLLHLAAAANRFTLSIVEGDLLEVLPDIESKPFGVHHYAQFLADMDAASTVLYIMDNACEAVFDKLLIKYLVDQGKEVAIAVRHKPILDDVTKQDAERLGLDELGDVVDPGVDMLGVVVSLANRKFQSRFYEADMVIAKGMSNCETLHHCKRDVYFLLVGASSCLCNELNINQDELILMKGGKDVAT